MGGFGSPSICLNVRTPSPQPSPLWEREFAVPAATDFHGKHLRSRGASRRPSFFGARLANCACLQNAVTSIAKPVRFKGKARGGPAFRSSVELRQIKTSRNKMKEAERRQTLGTTAASCDAARALLERARLTAFHHGSHLGEYFIPKVSFRPGFLGRGLNGRYPPSPVPVQGCTSHPGHNAGRLIPKPPESRLQTHPRAPPSLP